MFLEMDEKWSEIESKTKEALESLFPISDGKKTLEISSVEIKKPVAHIGEQRKAIIGGESLTTPVSASFTLKDEGRTISTAKIKLLDLPVITHRGTFVVQGKDYSVFHQMRLRPGVYTTRNEDTDAVASKFNLGRGLGFRIALSDDASVFNIIFDASKGASGGQAKVPLYSLLRVLGTPDEVIKKRWGDRLYEVNRAASDLIADTEQLTRLVIYKPTGHNVADLRNHFDKTILNEDTTKVTLGNAYKNVSAGALLDATDKLVRVYRREENEDDLDSLLFKEILGVEDHIFLRISKGARQLGGPLMKMKRKLKTADNVRDIVPSGIFTRLVETFFTTSSLASPQTEINPIEILETNHKITAMGEGGIQSEHGIPLSARNLHPSHFGFLDPVRTTESSRVGVDLRMTTNTKVKDRNIYAKFIDKNGEEVWLKPTDTVGKIVGFAEQRAIKGEVRALKDGEMIEVDRHKVDYWAINSKDMFTFTSGMVPFLHNTQGNRVTMASRMITQALPLKYREAPNVQVADGDSTVEQKIGQDHMVAKAPVAGKVDVVGPDYITVGGQRVDIYRDFPLNVKTMLHMTPVVKEGDIVKKGQTIAESNFTKNGTMALGTNLRVAYVPYKGWNHEDGIVISQTASEKLTSQHMYMEELPMNDDIEVDKKRYSSLFPLKVNQKMLAKLDENGVIKKGALLEKNDIIIAAIAKKTLTSSDLLLQRMDKKLSSPYKDSAVVWKHDRGGIVTDVVHTKEAIRILVKTVDPARVGDKLTGRYGNKGTITMILPDNEMPHTDNRPLDILLNPAGVISRVNPGQLYETMASKIAEKTGKPYRAENFSVEDSSKKVLNELKEHGLTPEETVTDPQTGKEIGKVLVGNQYILKLHKQTEGNFGARFTKAYDVNLQPSKGGEEGAKAVGLLDFYALLGHGARENLREMASYKSERNEEFWDAVKLGLPLPKMKEPFAFKKFKSMLGASGVRVSHDDTGYSVTPFTDKHVNSVSRGAINTGLMLKGSMNSLVPEKGGLFDPAVTGGLVGNAWSHINLSEPIVNPMFSKVVKVMLGGKPIDNMTGKEIEDELAKIDLDKRIPELKELIKKAKGTTKDKLIKELRYVSAAKKMGIHPKEYVLHKFPVLPPVYRPIYPAQGGGSPMVSDLNHLYRDLINTNNEMAQMDGFPDEHKAKLRAALKQAAGAVVGVTDPINVKSKKQELKGALTQLVGSTAKDGFFHRKLMYRPQDLTGRGTILPDPRLHVDEAGIPEEMLWEIFQPFIIRRLAAAGMDPIDATKAVQDKTEGARIALLQECKERPVLLNRAPTLHKYNIMAFMPKPIEGKSIFIPPLVIKGFNADFDGDSCSGLTWVLVEDEGIIKLKQIKDV